jgi:hypothetical protein
MSAAPARGISYAVAIRRSVVTITLLALTTICGVGCGEGEPQAGVEPPPPGTGVPIRGMERLAWDQPAPSFQRLRQYSFRVYIDRSASPLEGAECLDSSTSAGFPCSAPVPQMSNGTHTIALAAVADGVESTRSPSLIVTMNQGRAVVSGRAITDVEETGPTVERRAATGDGARFCIAPDACFTFHRQVTRPRPLAAPVALPDGRLLFVEGARDVRMLTDSTLLHQPALTVVDERVRIIGLFVDPHFERTRWVRVAWVEESAARRRTVVVMRFREFDNRLGDAAVVIPGIALPPTGEPRLAQDDNGRIYIAVPAAGDVAAGRMADGGRVLRFSAEGLAWSAGLGAPEFAPGFDDPDTLTVDPSDARLWLAGRDRHGAPGLRSIALGVAVSKTSSLVSVASDGLPPRRGRVMGLVPLGFADVAGVHFLGLDAEGRIWPAGADGTAVSEGFTIREEEVVGLSGGRSDAIYASTRSIAEAESSFSIFRLDRESR